jgi:hypothetical protein
MGFESNTGLGVYNQYGPRGVENGVVSGGELHGQGGAERDVTVYITGDDFNGTTSFNTELVIPAGGFFKSATFEVSEIFTTGNADNVFNVGTDTTESTNGVQIANPDVLGVTQDLTGAGTWAAALVANTSVGVSVTGTAAAVTAGSGRAKVVISYTKI